MVKRTSSGTPTPATEKELKSLDVRTDFQSKLDTVRIHNIVFIIATTLLRLSFYVVKILSVCDKCGCLLKLDDTNLGLEVFYFMKFEIYIRLIMITVV